MVDTCLPTWERSSAGVLPGEARAAGKECTHPPTMHSHTHTHARAHTHMHTHTLRSLHVHKHTHAVTSPRPHELTVLPAAANSCITASPGPGIQGLRDQASADHSSHTSSRCLWAQRRGGAPSLSICPCPLEHPKRSPTFQFEERNGTWNALYDPKSYPTYLSHLRETPRFPAALHLSHSSPPDRHRRVDSSALSGRVS